VSYTLILFSIFYFKKKLKLKKKIKKGKKIKIEEELLDARAIPLGKMGWPAISARGWDALRKNEIGSGGILL